MSCRAERAHGKHMIALRNALIELFESPVPESNPVGREVLTRVLGKQDIDFAKPILDVVSNPHLFPLIRTGVPPIVWETKERMSTNARTVLDPITTPGQELLLEFLGKFKEYGTFVFILVCTLVFVHVLVCTCTYFSFCACTGSY